MVDWIMQFFHGVKKFRVLVIGRGHLGQASIVLVMLCSNLKHKYNPKSWSVLRTTIIQLSGSSVLCLGVYRNEKHTNRLLFTVHFSRFIFC